MLPRIRVYYMFHMRLKVYFILKIINHNNNNTTDYT